MGWLPTGWAAWMSPNQWFGLCLQQNVLKGPMGVLV